MGERNKNELVITRIFDAPRETVWKYWTDSEYAKKWWGPKDFTCPFARIDFRTGGKYLLAMRSKEGQEFWSTGTFKEIVPMEKIVETDSFADKEGNIVPSTHYGMENFPLELEITVTFEDLGDKTRMRLTHSGIENIDERMRLEMEHGWNESFDKMNHEAGKEAQRPPGLDPHKMSEGQEARS
jgi:uncharacterized protein YndB with AHSA1/START domain